VYLVPHTKLYQIVFEVKSWNKRNLNVYKLASGLSPSRGVPPYEVVMAVALGTASAQNQPSPGPPAFVSLPRRPAIERGPDNDAMSLRLEQRGVNVWPKANVQYFETSGTSRETCPGRYMTGGIH
jgi:hypothetical protein